MIIKVPKKIEKEFLNLLEFIICSLDNGDETTFTKKELECLKFVKKLIRTQS